MNHRGQPFTGINRQNVFRCCLLKLVKMNVCKCVCCTGNYEESGGLVILLTTILPFLIPVVLKLSRYQNDLEGLLKQRWLGPPESLIQ